MNLPELHLADWRPTKDTLHLYCQILGKVRLATTKPRNHWWNAPLYVDVRGLTTRRLHQGETEFEIALDFVDDALVVQTGDGREGILLARGRRPGLELRRLICTRRFGASASTSRSRRSRSASR